MTAMPVYPATSGSVPTPLKTGVRRPMKPPAPKPGTKAAAAHKRGTAHTRAMHKKP